MRGFVGLVALANNNFSDFAFPSTGVWAQPRIIYEGTSEVTDYLKLMPGKYSFKYQFKEKSGVDSSDSLVMNILGPENLSYDCNTISVLVGKSTERTRTDIISQQGDYLLRFSLEVVKLLKESLQSFQNLKLLVCWLLVDWECILLEKNLDVKGKFFAFC
jgi:hypothetical protein